MLQLSTAELFIRCRLAKRVPGRRFRVPESTAGSFDRVACLLKDHLSGMHTKRFKRTLFIRSKDKKVQTNAYLTRTLGIQIFGEIPFVKPQNGT